MKKKKGKKENVKEKKVEEEEEEKEEERKKREKIYLLCDLLGSQREPIRSTEMGQCIKSEKERL